MVAPTMKMWLHSSMVFCEKYVQVSEAVIPTLTFVNSHPIPGEKRHHQRRQETRRRGARIDHRINRARVIGRQIVHVLVVGQRHRAVEAERQRDAGDARVRIGSDVRNEDDQETGQNVRCNNRSEFSKLSTVYSGLTHSTPSLSFGPSSLTSIRAT